MLTNNFTKMLLILTVLLVCFLSIDVQMYTVGILQDTLKNPSLTKEDAISNKYHMCNIRNSTALVIAKTVKNFCSCIPYFIEKEHEKTGSFGTSSWSLWKKFEDKIRQAARDSLTDCWQGKDDLKNLNETQFNELTGKMFTELNSYRMSKSIKSRGNPFVMERVLEVILRRIDNPSINPPLRIVVFGGSVTEGCWSYGNFIGLPKVKTLCKTLYTWTKKLERLLNKVLGNGTVIVRNDGIGGCDSSIGSIVLEYDLWNDPDYKLSDVDIFISAYSSNDGQNPIAQEENYQPMQQFLRLCQSKRPCSDLPLVIQLEDGMLEFVHKTVRSGLHYTQGMVETTSWGNFMSISYPDAIRDYVYQNPDDQTLTDRNLHPGLTHHTGLAWTVAYNLLDSLLNACNAPSLPDHDNLEPRAGYPLPILHNLLRSGDVYSAWKNKTEQETRMCEKGITTTKCIYKWVASRQDMDTAGKVQKAVEQNAIQINGWKAIGYPVRKPRRTFIAESANATFVLQFNNIEIPVNSLMILYLRSYGKEWESTKLSVIVEGKVQNDSKDWGPITHFYLEGEHDQQTSINYSYDANLGNLLKANSSIRITFILVSGNKFQINGLALCSRDQL